MLPDQFLLFAGTLPEPLFLLTDEGEILQANAAAHQLLGVAAQGLKGVKLHDLAQEDSGKLDQCLRLWARSREMLPAALSLRSVDGSTEKCHCGGALIQPRSDELPALILLRCQQKQVLTRGFVALNEQIERLRKEITVRKRVETKLRDSEAHFRHLVESAQAIPWELDLQTWCFNYVGPQAVDILGYPVEAWYKENFWAEHLHPDDRGWALKFCQESASRGQNHQFEYRMKAADNRYVWIRDDVNIRYGEHDPVALQGFMFDITERKHAEKRLQLQATALEAAANSIVITDREGEIQWVNPAFTAMTGYGLEEAVGQNPRLLKSGKQDRKFYRELWDTILSGQVWHGELINRRKDGSLYIDEQTVTPVCDEQGEITHFVAIKQDISERKHAEEAIKNIAAGVATKTGAEFFNQLVVKLAKLFEADYAFIGLLDDKRPDMVNSMAVSAFGTIADNMSYSLKDTPCATVVGQKTCIYPSKVQQQFPKDKLLQDMGVNSYIGTPLFDTENKPIGLISVLDSKPMRTDAAMVDILEIFAARASAEMERSRAEQRLQNTKQKLSLHVQQTPLGVIEWNIDFRVAEWNPAAEKMFGYTREEAMGRHAIGLIIPESFREQANEIWRALLENRGGYRSTNENINKDGRSIMCEWYNTPLVADNGEVIGVASLVDDITDRTRAEAAVQHMAYHDALTGLVNRSEFELRLQELLVDARDQGSVHAMLYLDLDQFKIINDTCGHAAGDAMLKALTSLLQEQVRDSDTLARLGGDEFGMLLSGCPLSQAQRVAEDIIQAIKEFRFDWKGASFETGASIGMVSITSESEDIAKIMSAADMACYMAKDMGRGRVRVYVEDDAELARRHGEMAWVSRINQAMEDNRFVLYQQDIIALGAGKHHTDHKELLLRLRDGNGHLIVPDEFIPPAERYNLMPALDRWVIHESFTEIAKNSSNGCQYSINLSGTSLNDDDLIDYIQGQFEETGLAPGRICFEITETTAISNLARAARLIHDLKAMGCQFSLDDFGKGASSFTYLKNLSVDYLKIDGGFVSGFMDDPTDYAIIESINKIGHALGIQTVAECVEDEASLKKLEEIGVNFAQGYIIARPEPFKIA